MAQSTTYQGKNVTLNYHKPLTTFINIIFTRTTVPWTTYNCVICKYHSMLCTWYHIPHTTCQLPKNNGRMNRRHQETWCAYAKYRDNQMVKWKPYRTKKYKISTHAVPCRFTKDIINTMWPQYFWSGCHVLLCRYGTVRPTVYRVMYCTAYCQYRTAVCIPYRLLYCVPFNVLLLCRVLHCRCGTA